MRTRFQKYPGVIEVRGKGLMIGVQLDRPCLDISKMALKHKILINVVANCMIRLLPALILTQLEADELVERLDQCLNDFFNGAHA